MRTARPSGTRRPLTQLIGAVTALATAAALLVAPDAAGAAADEPVDVTVDATVERLIAEEGVAEAVVTTWDRDGLAEVRGLGVEGVELRHLPMVLVPELDAGQLERLEASPAVRSVYPNERYEVHMEETSWILGARDVWEGLDGEPGVTGDGIEIAVIDTGATGRHLDWGNLIEFCNTTSAVAGDPLEGDRALMPCSPFDPDSGNAGPAGTDDDARLDSVEDFPHGSHVSGTIAGTGAASGGMDDPHSTIGIAPEASIRMYKANVGAFLFPFQILVAYDDLTWKKLNGFNDVVAVNNSWGGGIGNDYDPDSAQAIAFQAAYDAGILSVFSAGNSGPGHNTLGVQCTSPFVVCVGASTKGDQVVMFSSRGRPAAPADTEHDGGVGTRDDEQWANHDRDLALAMHETYGIGLYRPTLVAPGAAINSMDMVGGTGPCTEDSPEPESCYEQLQGTSMSAPHVSGAVALIAEAFQEAHGEPPSPAIVTEILEASANLAKLPGYTTAEQGAGRLNIPDAVRMARSYPAGLPPVNLGTPPPPFADGMHPGAEDARLETQIGCTGEFSWSPRTLPEELEEFPEPPPVSTQRFASHTVDIPEDAERLRVVADWSATHPGANLYLRIWRPGTDPAMQDEDPGPDRVFPDQEFANLIYFADQRPLDVRSPEPGEWTVTVYHRTGGQPTACDPDAEQEQDHATGFNYELRFEVPRAAEQPTAAITGADVADGLIDLFGMASYPNRWDGVTHWEVWDSGYPGYDLEDRTRLHFRGNLDTDCTGEGSIDVDFCDGPFLMDEEPQTFQLPARWDVPNPAFQDDGTDRNNSTPNWVWWLDEPTTVAGPMTVSWWADCPGCGTLGTADWWIRLWADGELVVERRVKETPGAEPTASRLTRTIDVPTTAAEESLVLQIAPVFVDTQSDTTIYYDSTAPCGFDGDGNENGDLACDSFVDMPVDSGIATDVRATDLPDVGLRLAWTEVPGASSYEIHRSDQPDFEPSSDTEIATTAGTACDSPDVPSWPTASRSGLCYLDTGAPSGQVSYYRVVAVTNPAGPASLVTYGQPTTYDRQVQVRVDRLFGPAYWEYADLVDAQGTAWSHTWDTQGIDAEADEASVRSFTQGVGSASGAVDIAAPPDDPDPDPDPAPTPVTGGGGALLALLLLAGAGALALGRRRVG